LLYILIFEKRFNIKIFGGEAMKETCSSCYGMDDQEFCRNKFSPNYGKFVGCMNSCQMIETDETVQDVHPSTIRDNVWDTGMRHND
jgi:hypothetical protein